MEANEKKKKHQINENVRPGSITVSVRHHHTRIAHEFHDLFVLRFYGPVNPVGSSRARSVYLTTRLLGRLSHLSKRYVFKYRIYEKYASMKLVQENDYQLFTKVFVCLC